MRRPQTTPLKTMTTTTAPEQSAPSTNAADATPRTLSFAFIIYHENVIVVAAAFASAASASAAFVASAALRFENASLQNIDPTCKRGKTSAFPRPFQQRESCAHFIAAVRSIDSNNIRLLFYSLTLSYAHICIH